jgi:hypothetical protein|eukprot:31187-Pelagococcus_subviridis.AAC.6
MGVLSVQVVPGQRCREENDDLVIPQGEDLHYEEELLRSPRESRLWFRYLDAKKGSSARRRYIIFERSVQALPGSYKVRDSPFSSFSSKVVFRLVCKFSNL